MSLKRRIDAISSDHGFDTPAAPPRLSAVAAARQRAFPDVPWNEGAVNVPVVVTSTSAVHGATGNGYPTEPEYESDDDYVETSQGDLEPDQVQAPVAPQIAIPLTLWRSSPENILVDDNSQLTIKLQNLDTIVVLGVYDVSVKHGAVTINGALLQANQQSQRVFALPTHSLPVIQGAGTKPAIVRLATCPTMKKLAHLSPTYEKIWHVEDEKGPRRSFGLVYRHVRDDLQRTMVPAVAPAQQLALKLLSGENPIVLISGTKCSGKNMFANNLTNKYLSTPGTVDLCYLDLDAGKPEYTPQGQISLIWIRKLNMGPPYTHPAPIPDDERDNGVVWAHPMPLNGLKDYPEYFISCVVDLMRRYKALRSDHLKLALVINTPAWSYQDGVDLFLQMIGCIQPTRTLYIQSGQPESKFTSLVEVACEKDGIAFERIDAQPTATKLKGDATLTEMHMLAYFHCEDTDESSGQRIYSATPLSCMNPFEVYYGTDPSRPLEFVGVLMLDDWSHPNCIATILNGSIITIVETSDPEVQALYGTLPRTQEGITTLPLERAGIPYFPPDANVVSPLNPATTKVICTALIRGFDVSNQTLHVLIPQTHDRLLMALEPHKTVLVSGCCEYPAWAYTEDPYSDIAEQKGTESGSRIARLGATLPPWVANGVEMEQMGQLNTARKSRRFHGV